MQGPGPMTPFTRRLFLSLLAALPTACAAPARRPQDPATRPYPHRTVTIPRATGALAGEIVSPTGTGPFPAVLLLSGSGPQDRDETVAGHRPFLLLSDAFARAGIASLRYDKRGVGSSAGDFATATITDFARDGGAAFDWLATQPEFDSDRIALLGHSEGGLTAPLAARGRNVAALVLMAGPGLPMERIIRRQTEVIAQQSGASATEIIQFDHALAEIFEVLRHAPDAVQAKPGIEAAVADLPRQVRRNFMDMLATPWGHDAVRHDPRTVLEAFPGPVLALFGAKDVQVDAIANAAALRALVQRHSAFQVQIYPGLNHLFQPSDTGSPQDYARIETTMAPEVITAIIHFLRQAFSLF